MTYYHNRPEVEQNLISLCYEFEVAAILNNSADPNPYIDALKAIDKDGALLEALNEALEMRFH